MAVPTSRCRIIAAFVFLAFTVAGGASAKPYSEEDLAKLTSEQKQRLFDYLDARAAHAAIADRYWAIVEAKRKARRKKDMSELTREDFVFEHPPVYKGPPSPDDVFRILAKPKPKPEPPPVVADFLSSAKRIYGFIPLAIPDAEFKRRYAREALRLGMTKDQIVRVYSLETGGYGTYDMQAGFNPKTGKTTPISTALGYAQLLAANSVEVLAKHGTAFAARLEAMAKLPQEAGRAAVLREKADIVRRMSRDARAVPYSWSSHVRFANTPKGMAIHAMNLDGDVGPWMQIIKLRAIVDYAAKNGKTNLTGGQLEMMNLAGPASGFEMLLPVARDAVTANFFQRGGYERNPVVHNRTASELLKKIDEIMDRNRLKDGARQFDAIFDALLTQ
jgi:hypothetical protein